uniref:Uncharacterized protein n=1 Tax=Aegilops tauschii subsp. strangulata TaxID=200361 RepID=A0A453BB56_AEGTS
MSVPTVTTICFILILFLFVDEDKIDGLSCMHVGADFLICWANIVSSDLETHIFCSQRCLEHYCI